MSQSYRTHTNNEGDGDDYSVYTTAEYEVILNRGSYALLVGHEVDDTEWRMVNDHTTSFGTERGNRYYNHRFTKEEMESGEMDKWHLPESRMFSGPELHAYMAANKRYLTNILWRELVNLDKKKIENEETLSYEQEVDLVREAIVKAPIQTEVWGVILYSYRSKPDNR